MTAVAGNGFWMTDPTPDDDDDTSDGIFVFRGVAAVGDHVHGQRDGRRVPLRRLRRVREPDDDRDRVAHGERVERRQRAADGRHRRRSAARRRWSSTTTRPPPSRPPTRSSTRGNDGIDFWESLEGMRLRSPMRSPSGRRMASARSAVISQRAERGRAAHAARRHPGSAPRPCRQLPARRLQPGAPHPGRRPGTDARPEHRRRVQRRSGRRPRLQLRQLQAARDRGPGPGRQRPGARGHSAPRSSDLSVATFNVENLSAFDSDAKVNAAGRPDRQQPALAGHHRHRGDAGQHRLRPMTASRPPTCRGSA